jgi:hypothetical protein
MAVSGGWQLTLLGRVASIRSLYTPMLVFTLLACIRVAWSYRAHIVPFDTTAALRVIRLGSAALVVAAAMLSPVLYAVGVRIAEGRWDTEKVYWRSSPQGIDIVSFVLPNPNHMLAPNAIRQWLTGPSADRYFENVASLTWIAPLVIFIAWRNGWRISRFWAGLGLVFGALAVGPFVYAFGMNTHVPGPWAFLRYVPIIGLARTPGRFSIVVMLVVAILFAAALSWLVRRWPERRRSLILASGALLIFELLPAPRPLYSAAIPRIYQYIAEAPGDVRVLELPSGVRDGTTSVGNFSARTQFFQTVHGKRLIGGYLSRVSRRRVEDVRSDPMVDALIWLSEGRSIDASRQQSLIEAGPSFIQRANVGFVVIDSARAPDALREFAIRAFALQFVDRDDVFELYAPSPHPPAAELSRAAALH